MVGAPMGPGRAGVRWRTDAAFVHAQYARLKETKERSVIISHRLAKEGERYFARQEQSGESADLERRGAIRMKAPRLFRLSVRPI